MAATRSKHTAEFKAEAVKKVIEKAQSYYTNDDLITKRAIANVVKDRLTFGYHSVWACLRLEGHDQVNHKRFTG